MSSRAGSVMVPSVKSLYTSGIVNFALKLRRLLAMKPAERRLFLQAELLFVLVWAGLKVLSLRRCQILLKWLASRQRSSLVNGDVATSTHRTVAVMRTAARHTFGQPACLPQSLVCWALLRRQGIEGDLRIGTRREGGKFEAHAWVEYQGRVLNDHPDVRERFVSFEQPIDSAESMK